jgi:hypothetical protein
VIFTVLTDNEKRTKSLRLTFLGLPIRRVYRLLEREPMFFGPLGREPIVCEPLGREPIVSGLAIQEPASYRW